MQQGIHSGHKVSMQILVTDPLLQTQLFLIVLGIIFIATFVTKRDYTPHGLTQELKGFAMLCILFAHIGYTLASDNQFLFPISVLAGVSVNVFLFLSGYGLTFSHIKKDESIVTFYKRRVLKLLIPFWITLCTFLLLDAFVLGQTYAPQFILQSFLGIFNKASMLTDFNSPLWYFSLIFFYYLTFPLLFSKKRPWVTAILLYGIVWGLVEINPFFFDGVIGLYQVHMLAFPLGMLFAWYVSMKKGWEAPIAFAYKKHHRFLYPTVLSLLLAFIGYFALNAHVGDIAYKEELTSLVIMFAIFLLFILKKRESKLFSLFGLFSYEIYLFHWPLLVRYDVLYTRFEPWLATLLYLGVFILLGLLLQKTSGYIFKKLGLS